MFNRTKTWYDDIKTVSHNTRGECRFCKKVVHGRYKIFAEHLAVRCQFASGEARSEATEELDAHRAGLATALARQKLNALIVATARDDSDGGVGVSGGGEDLGAQYGGLLPYATGLSVDVCGAGVLGDANVPQSVAMPHIDFAPPTTTAADVAREGSDGAGGGGDDGDAASGAVASVGGGGDASPARRRRVRPRRFPSDAVPSEYSRSIGRPTKFVETKRHFVDIGRVSNNAFGSCSFCGRRVRGRFKQFAEHLALTCDAVPPDVKAAATRELVEHEVARKRPRTAPPPPVGVVEEV